MRAVSIQLYQNSSRAKDLLVTRTLVSVCPSFQLADRNEPWTDRVTAMQLWMTSAGQADAAGTDVLVRAGVCNLSIASLLL